MYERKTNSGQTVEWNPDNQDWAAQALADVAGTGVSSSTEAKNKAAVDLGNDGKVAKDVRIRYEEIKEANTV